MRKLIDDKVDWWQSWLMRKSIDEKVDWWESQLMRMLIDEKVDWDSLMLDFRFWSQTHVHMYRWAMLVIKLLSWLKITGYFAQIRGGGSVGKIRFF